MKRQVVDARLDSLGHCIARIESKKPFTLEQLQKDFDLQDIVSVNLERAVQSAVDIALLVIAELPNVSAPQSMVAAFDRLWQQDVVRDHALVERLKKAVGFRNILVHEYAAVDWQIVHAVAHKGLGDLQAFGAVIDAWLTARG